MNNEDLEVIANEYKCINYNEMKECKTCDGYGRNLNDKITTDNCYKINNTITDLELLAKTLKGKDIIVLNTCDKNSLEFALAHVLRSLSKRTFCIDKNYKMINEPLGYREIENGKVILIKGDLHNDKDRIYDILNSMNAEISYEIDVHKIKEWVLDSYGDIK